MSEPRALLIKCSKEDDFYVAWSENTESPHWHGTRAEAAEYGYTEERINRADKNGTSSWPMIDTERMIPWEGGPFYAWDDAGMIAEQRGFLPRRHLREYALRYAAGNEQGAFDLLEPFEDEAEVRR